MSYKRNGNTKGKRAHMLWISLERRWNTEHGPETFLVPATLMPNNHESGWVSRDMVWRFEVVWEGKRSEPSPISDPSRNPRVSSLCVINAKWTWPLSLEYAAKHQLAKLFYRCNRVQPRVEEAWDENLNCARTRSEGKKNCWMELDYLEFTRSIFFQHEAETGHPEITSVLKKVNILNK